MQRTEAPQGLSRDVLIRAFVPSAAGACCRRDAARTGRICGLVGVSWRCLDGEIVVERRRQWTQEAKAALMVHPGEIRHFPGDFLPLVRTWGTVSLEH